MKLHHIRIAGIFAALIAVACASTGGSWEEARQKDTPGAYHRFLRDHPDAEQEAEARERLAFAKIKKRPTAEGYEKFRATYPQSSLLAEIAQVVEEPLFERARARGTVEAYREFLAEFPTGSYADRAAGNMEYLEKRGFRGSPAELSAFAARHAASDFAKEAARSGASPDARRKSEFREVGFVVEIAKGTPGGDRVARALSERTRRQLAKAGVKVVPLKGANDPRRPKGGVMLVVRHSEQVTKPDISGGGSAFSGVLATTDLTLKRAGDAQPIWSEQLTFRVGLSERKEDESILFSATGDRYWDAFHVPVATWNTQQAARAPFGIGGEAVAVDAVDHRAFVLFESGDFQVVDFSDPAAPVILGRYRRPSDLSKWEGIRVLGGRVVIFGGDGVEAVDLAGGEMKRVMVLDRTRVGSIVAVERAGSDWILAGSRGVMVLRSGASEPELLLEMGVLGAAMSGDRLVFTNGESLYVATVAALRRQKAEGQLRFGKSLGAGRVRTWGKTAVVLGETDVLLVDLSKPSAPRAIARVTALEAGEVEDAMVSRGRLFVLGSRGLQMLDASGRRLVDATDVSSRTRLDAAGRHLVMIGDAGLQTVDTTPFVTSKGLAAPRP